ncbi:amidase [Gilvimarinus sp. F26214L]|uniref:amidase n=1 Tax=Gilvimarinus sp. DZF01 TaxID=3461371 RepID=UPI0040453EA9
MSPGYPSAGELARRIREGETTSVAALEAMLERINRYNPDLNAIVYLDAESARQRALEADAAHARGELWGPLHGLPMTIKETYEIAGMPTTAGATELKDYRSRSNAVAAQRLLDAGAIIVGKSNVPLWAGDLQSYNEIYGTTNNPWDLDRTPGGSSGGAAAALAAGLTALEYGSDIGGSIRTPASFCGVCGHKPSYGIVPPRGHVPGPPGSRSKADIGVMGPLARTVDDLELALDLTAGPDPEEGVAWRLDLPEPRHRDLGSFRIAAWLDDDACPVDREIAGVLSDMIRTLQDAGAKIDQQARPEGVQFGESYDLYYQLLTGALGARMSERSFRKQAEIAAAAGPEDRSYRVRFARGATQSHNQWLQANERRMQLRHAWAQFFTRFDILLCPVTNSLPFPHDHSNPVHARTLSINGQPTPYTDILAWVGLTGVVYLPVTVVPVGFSTSGLPVGVQIVGPYLEDRTCLEFARHLESLSGGFRAPPGYGS